MMAAQRIAFLITEGGEDLHTENVEAFSIPAAWDADDVDRFLNAQEYDWATVTTLQDVPEEYR